MVQFDEYKWKGRYKDGLPDGKGKLRLYSTGDLVAVFRGVLNRGHLNSGSLEVRGRFTYKGEFEAGLPEGEGTIDWGSVNYSGLFHRGLPHGKGKKVAETSNTFYIGDFVNGKECGQGAVYQRALSAQVQLEGQVSGYDFILADHIGEAHMSEWTCLYSGQWLDGKPVSTKDERKR